MTDISTMPQVINIDHYAGDTLTIHIKIPPEVVDGRSCQASVKSKAPANKVDAWFLVTITSTGMDIVLPAAESARLAKRTLYEGVWDVQLSADGGFDPITTLAYGEIRLHPEVTRWED